MREFTESLALSHGEARRGARTVEYKTWVGMKRRCYNTNERSYPDYGGRGIRICDRWLNDFLAFVADMGRRPGDDYSIDRIDHDGDYEPGNCRWIKNREQARNKRSNLHVEYQGRKMLLVEAAEASGLPLKELHRRIFIRGWTTERAFSQPLRVNAASRTGAPAST